MDGGAFRLSDYPQIGQVGAVPLATPETGTVGGSGRSTMFRAVVLDRHEQASGRELRVVPPGLERARSGQQQSRPDSHDGTVHGRLREQRRRHPGPGLSRAGVEPDYMEPNRWQAAATYVTGAHNMKVGYQGVFHWNRLTPTATTTTSITGSTTACRTSSRSSRGRTSRLAHAIRRPVRTGPVDSRKVHRSEAIRYDHAWSYYPAQQIGPTQFIPQALSSRSPRASSAITTSTRVRPRL